MHARRRRDAVPRRAPRVGVVPVAGAALAILLLTAAAAIAGTSTSARAAAVPAAAAAQAVPNAVARPAAPSGTASTTVGRGGDALELSVTPVRGLAPYGAEIEVRGSGFDDGADLWIAVCQDDGAAPESLAHCVGGAIPDSNGTSAWGVVTSAKQPPYAGPVMSKWHRKGSFSLTLQIPAAAGQDADCLAARCSVYTRSSDDADRSQDARVPVQFAAASGATSGRSGGGTATTQTLGGARTTVSPDSVAETSVAAGGQQVVVFSGFTPGEAVDVTLFSDPITLPVAKADGRGVVTVAFTVPAELPPGEHLVQAVGRQSGRVGIAQFEVGEAAAETSPTGTAETTTLDAPTTDATASAVGAAPDETGDPAPVSTAQTSVAEATDASTVDAAVTAADPTAADAPDGANRLLWLWIVLLAIVLIGGAAGAVVLLRRRRDRDDEQDLQPVDEILPQPGWAAYQDPTDRAGWPVHPIDPTAPAGADPVVPAPADAGPETEAWAFDPAPADAGPETEAWAFDPAPAAQAGPFDPGPATEEWRPAFEPDAGRQDGNGDAVPDLPGDRPSGGRHRSE